MITFSVYTSSLRLHGIKFARNIFKGFTWDPTDVFIFQAPPQNLLKDTVHVGFSITTLYFEYT
jgi:hypothetical protein